MKKLYLTILIAIVIASGAKQSHAQCSVSTTTINNVCNGACDGSATALPVGTPAFSYSWNTIPAQNTQTATGLCAGTYTVTMTDNLGCVATGGAVITDPPAIIHNISSTPSQACPCTGTATDSASGGTGTLTYSWNTSPSQGSMTATGLCGGSTYTVTVTDANFCTSKDSVTISQSPGFTVSISSTASSQCACTGTASAIPAGGIAPYSYSWSTSPVQTDSTATGLCGDSTYFVLVIDGNGCAASDIVTITKPADLTATITGQTASSQCACTGTATAAGGGGLPPYTFSWSNGDNSATADSLCGATTYTVTVTDANGCIATDDVTITQPAALTATITGQTTSSCTSCTGTATAAAGGGLTPYTYSWNTTPVQTGTTATGLCGGTTYTVTATDANGCLASDPVIITSGTVTVTASPGSVACNGDCSATSTASASGGTLPYTYSWSTTPVQTDSTATGLCGGSTYTVIATDADGCSGTAPVTISQPPLLTATISSQTNVACNGECTGSATVTAGGGTGAYTYSWSPSGQTTATATGLCAGIYTVTVTDANGCDTTTAPVTITEPPLLTAAISSQTNVACNGECTGSATVTAGGGTGAYTYSWSPSGQTTATATGLCAGAYTVTVTDANGCDSTATVTITEPPLLTATIASQINVTCNGECTGSATVSAGGGTPAYTYSWNTSPVQTTATATGLCAGIYTATVTDANGCTETAPVTITEPTALTAAITSQVNVLCNGECTGSATVTAGGGTGAYTYSWDTSPAQTTTTATGLCAGNYTVTVTDANGCDTTATATITEPTALTVTVPSQTASSACACTGTADASASGGTPAYTYSWSTTPVQTDITATGLCGGTDYTVTVTDANACTADTTVTIGGPTPLVVIISSATADCGACTGDATASASGGTSAYTYSWNTGPVQTTATATGLCDGTTYTVTVTDASACDTNTTITMTGPPDASFTSSAPGCVGQGVNFYSVNSYPPGYSYFWQFGSGATPATDTVQNPTNIVYSTSGAKTVTLTITSGACDGTEPNIITINPVPVASFTSTAPKCTGDTVSFTNTGTSGVGVTYLWDFGDGATPATSSAQNPSGVTYATAGTKTITLTVTNQFGCSTTVTQTITINQTPVASFTSTAPACTGDSVDFLNIGTSGATYLWNFGSGATPPSSSAFSPNNVVYSTSGIKTVKLITTLGSCTDSITQTININQTPAPAFTSNAPQCEGQIINLSYTGTTGTGWTYNWDFGTGASPATSSAQNPDSVIYAGAGTKTITLTVTNDICSQTITGTITINPTPVANFSSTAPACTDDLVDFLNTGTSGATYFWNFGSDATPGTSATENPTGIVYSTSGTKTVKLITTLGSCTDSITQTININQTPAPAFTSNAPKCEGAAVTFNYIGTTGIVWTYNWDFGTGASPAGSSAQNPDSVIYTGAGTKTITLTVTNDICSQDTTGTITINQTPVSNFSSTAPACTGDSVDFTNTGTTGASYLWDLGAGASPATTTAENPQNVVYGTPGTKSVKLVTTLGTCVDSVINTINITETPAPSFTHNAPQCEGAAVTFTYTGTTGLGWTYNWDFGTGASPATSSAQTPGSVVYTGAGTKTITLTVTNDICSQTITGTITTDSLPDVNAGNDTIICANTSVQIGSSTQTGSTYNWFPTSTLSSSTIADPVASPVAPVTIYTVTMTNTATGCQATDSVVVSMLAPLIADAGIDVEICINDSIQIGAGLIEGQLYSWSPGAGLSSTTSPNTIANPSITTTYILTVTSAYGCAPVTDDVVVTVHPLPDAQATDIFGRDTAKIVLGSSIGLKATGGVQYEWWPVWGLDFPAVDNPVATPDSTTDYVVTVTDLFGCVNTDTVRVEVIDSIEFFVPTIFTPDGNGFNDVFYVRTGDLKEYELIVFDRWGERIFLSRSASVGWDGREQGSSKEMPQGAYVYSFKGTMENGETISESGIINLIR